MIVEVPVGTLTVTHIYDGEEVVTAGDDGQVWVATFADRTTANVFIKMLQRVSSTVKGERNPQRREEGL